MNNMRLRGPLVALALTVSPLAAFAGGHAQVLAQSPDKSADMSIEYDGDFARMQTADRPNTYFLVRDNKAYAVSKEDGGTKVFDMNQVAQLLQSHKGMGGGMMGGRRFGGGMGGHFGGNRPQINMDVAEVKSLKDTGKTETVAGITGNVYTLEYVDKDGNSKTTDAVLSKDSRARDFTKAMYTIGTTLRDEMGTGEGENKVAGTSALWKQIDSQDLGLLRFGDNLKITSLDNTTPPSSDFELPGPVTPIENMRDLRQLRSLRGE